MADFVKRWRFELNKLILFLIQQPCLRFICFFDVDILNGIFLKIILSLLDHNEKIDGYWTIDHRSEFALDSYLGLSGVRVSDRL